MNTVENALVNAIGYNRCNADNSYCVSRYWFTEFGYGTFHGCQVCSWGVACDAGVAAVDVMNVCSAGAPYCNKMFYWDLLEDSSPCPAGCDPQILTPAGSITPKYCTLKQYITTGAIPPACPPAPCYVPGTCTPCP